MTKGDISPEIIEDLRRQSESDPSSAGIRLARYWTPDRASDDMRCQVVLACGLVLMFDRGIRDGTLEPDEPLVCYFDDHGNPQLLPVPIRADETAEERASAGRAFGNYLKDTGLRGLSKIYEAYELEAKSTDSRAMPTGKLLEDPRSVVKLLVDSEVFVENQPSEKLTISIPLLDESPRSLSLHDAKVWVPATHFGAMDGLLDDHNSATG